MSGLVGCGVIWWVVMVWLSDCLVVSYTNLPTNQPTNHPIYLPTYVPSNALRRVSAHTDVVPPLARLATTNLALVPVLALVLVLVLELALDALVESSVT